MDYTLDEENAAAAYGIMTMKKTTVLYVYIPLSWKPDEGTPVKRVSRQRRPK
jgi:hypothetical protein